MYLSLNTLKQVIRSVIKGVLKVGFISFPLIEKLKVDILTGFKSSTV
jgi:hypothetical protein